MRDVLFVLGAPFDTVTLRHLVVVNPLGQLPLAPPSVIWITTSHKLEPDQKVPVAVPWPVTV